jgi:hypothetical protein
MASSGARALENGLDALPAHFDETVGYPLAFWKSQHHGAVVFLTFGPQFETVKSPHIWHMNYQRVHETLEQPGSALGQERLGDGPTVEAKIESILGGRSLVTTSTTTGDSPAVILTGWHSMKVRAMTFIQSGGSQPLAANGHYGAWVIGSDSAEPWQIEARDDMGRLSGSIDKDS